MAKFYAPNFSGILPLFDGKSAAGGKLYAYRAGSSIPAPLFNEDGVELGSWVSIDSNGCADFLLDSALSYKLIAKDALGAVVGEWDNVKATNAEGMQNPMTTEGDIIVGGTDGEPSRLGVGSAGQVLTSDGTTWAPAAIPTQPGDHKTAVDGADSSPDYLANKLAAGSGISLTNTGSALEISATGGGGGGGSYQIYDFAPPLDQMVIVDNSTTDASHTILMRKSFSCNTSKKVFLHAFSFCDFATGGGHAIFDAGVYVGPTATRTLHRGNAPSNLDAWGGEKVVTFDNKIEIVNGMAQIAILTSCGTSSGTRWKAAVRGESSYTSDNTNSGIHVRALSAIDTAIDGLTAWNVKDKNDSQMSQLPNPADLPAPNQTGYVRNTNVWLRLYLSYED